MNRSLGWLGLIVALVLVVGAVLWLQRQEGDVLRAEIALLRDERAELVRLQSEQTRLRAALPAAAEMDRLRAEHAAVERLRNEVERLKDSVQARERALTPRGK